MATACVFCGASGTMTKEHVLPDWLERIGLTGQPAAAGSGWLNRSSEYRQTSRPFQTTVKAVCATCNNGWMSQLEQIAGRVLAPIIRGEATTVPDKDQPTLAMWALKTTLMAMRSSSQQDRDQGYGLPPTEFTDLPRQKDQLRPPDHVQVWLGHYSGQQHLASVQATPVIVTADPPAEPAHPHAYAFSVLVGQALLQGIRFTTPSLALDLTTEQGLTQIWPTRGDLEWPAGEPIPDLALPRVQKGLNLLPVGPGLHLLPFRPAVDLPRSTAEGQMVRLPTACGKESGTIWGSYAAAAWRSGVLVNAGCHRWKSSASWSLRTRTRTCNRRCAPRGVQRICCFLTMRLLTSWLTADSTNEVEMVSPAR